MFKFLVGTVQSPSRPCALASKKKRDEHVRAIPQTIQLPLPTGKPAISLVSEAGSSERKKMKIILWIVGIIFLIGLLVVTGVFKLIF